MKKIDQVAAFNSGYEIDTTSSCWVWQGKLNNRGYPMISNKYAHRIGYELLVGSIPLGHEVDHLCFNPKCVNPQHLEAVTPLVNMRRAFARITHCPKGHEYTDANVFWKKTGKYLARNCRECNRLRCSKNGYALRARLRKEAAELGLGYREWIRERRKFKNLR